MNNRTGVKFRQLDPSNKSELGFVFKSWIRSFENHCDDVPLDVYPKFQQAMIERILRHSIIVLAVHPEHADQIFGFAVVATDSPTLHYIYVKGDYRRTGVGTDLLEFINEGNASGEFSFTSRTRLGYKFLSSRGGKYRPKLKRSLK